MKKTLIFFFTGILVFSSFITNPSSAQIGVYYKLPDYCGRYNLGCIAIVDKCREWGNDYCAAFEQKPCDEVCDLSMAP